MTLARTARYHYLKMIRLKDRPHVVALGMALGVFIGCTPTIPIQTAMAVPLAAALRGSKAGAAAGVWVSNPFTVAAFYLADLQVGHWILGWEINFSAPDFFSFFSLLYQAKLLLLAMLVGGVVIGLPMGVIAYVATYKGMLMAKERREKRPIRP
ncbi:MAG: DUF2062 domain-containing protein [Deltaproteobacteria bacterium]|nr:DUF2062 domain-containing protein [Deltaproteobacteria bacterium]